MEQKLSEIGIVFQELKKKNVQNNVCKNEKEVNNINNNFEKIIPKMSQDISILINNNINIQNFLNKLNFDDKIENSKKNNININKIKNVGCSLFKENSNNISNKTNNINNKLFKENNRMESISKLDYGEINIKIN